MLVTYESSGPLLKIRCRQIPFHVIAVLTARHTIVFLVALLAVNPIDSVGACDSTIKARPARNVFEVAFRDDLRIGMPFRMPFSVGAVLRGSFVVECMLHDLMPKVFIVSNSDTGNKPGFRCLFGEINPVWP